MLAGICGVIITSIFLYDRSKTQDRIKGSSVIATDPATVEEEAVSDIPPCCDAQIAAYISQMSLEEKVGQLFIFGFQGNTPTPHILRYVSEYKIGGVMLLFYNLPDDPTARNNIAALNSHAVSTGNSIPLFMAVDQEGGTVNAFRYWDAAQKIGQKQLESEQQAKEVAIARSNALKSMGVNINFAPTADYITNPASFLYRRSFAGDSGNVGKMASAMISGADEAGIVTNLKHFPGHTNYAVDTHKNLASFTVPEQEMQESLNSFSISLKNADPDIVMMAHVRYENYDSEDIASMSDFWISEKLRGEQQYNGIVITDDMTMKSVTKTYGVNDAAVKAILAGNDILLYVGSPDMQSDAYNAVINAVHDGTISEERINQSLFRILKLKNEKLGMQF